MQIQVLGAGCASCDKLYQIVEEALDWTGIPAELTKITEYQDIMKYGVVNMPALVVNGAVVSAGRMPDVAQVTTWLTTAAYHEHTAKDE